MLFPGASNIRNFLQSQKERPRRNPLASLSVAEQLHLSWSETQLSDEKLGRSLATLAMVSMRRKKAKFINHSPTLAAKTRKGGSS